MLGWIKVWYRTCFSPSATYIILPETDLQRTSVSSSANWTRCQHWWPARPKATDCQGGTSLNMEADNDAKSPRKESPLLLTNICSSIVYLSFMECNCHFNTLGNKISGFQTQLQIHPTHPTRFLISRPAPICRNSKSVEAQKIHRHHAKQRCFFLGEKFSLSTSVVGSTCSNIPST